MAWDDAARSKRWPPLSEHDKREILYRKSRQMPSGCVEWTGSTNTKGYGNLSVRWERWMAHRLAYTLAYGPIPEGMQVCHTCDNRRCIRPEHLFIGTNQDNVTDKMRKGRHYLKSRTICKRGHPLAGDNVRISKLGHRQCIACDKGSQRVKNGWPEDLAYWLEPLPHGSTWRDVVAGRITVGRLKFPSSA